MVISREAGMVYGSPLVGLTRTLGFLNSGKYLEIGSSRRNLPSSYSIITATLVIGLDMEQMRKMASLRMGLLASRSSEPCDLNQTTLPWRATRVTAPAMRFSSTAC